jgi:hypothetical protein
MHVIPNKCNQFQSTLLADRCGLKDDCKFTRTTEEMRELMLLLAYGTVEEEPHITE